jgi:hypothetical protein
MPFKPEDAENHKKGLTPKQAKQWARVAESVRKREMKAGKSEEDAAVSAIKQANGVVMNTNDSKGKYAVYKNKQVLDYEVKLTVHQEKAHLVVPVVMMVEGVHNGSQGPLFHSITELGKFPESWNGIPVVIYHPEEDGNAVSANSPDIIDKMTVGRVYNTSVEGKKLKAEVWLDEDKLNTISTNTLEDINETKEVEVSLGMFTENEMEEGEYKGEKYIGIAHNHRPDHLAILPDQVGACSCADGCGLGANEEKKKKCVNEEDDEDDEDDDDDIVKNKRKKDSESGKIESLTSADDVNSGLTRIKSTNNKKEDKKMAENKCPKCLEKIDALIANVQSPFVEADREWLLAQEETLLDKLTPVVKEVEKIVEKTVEINKLSNEDQAALAFGKKQLKERKEKMVKGIQANTDKVWTDEKLGGMDEDTLEGIYKSVVKEEPTGGNYLLNGGGVTTNAESDEVLYPAGVVIEVKK